MCFGNIDYPSPQLPGESYFKSSGEINTFQDRHTLKQLMTTHTVWQKTLKEIIHIEEEDSHKHKCSGKNKLDQDQITNKNKKRIKHAQHSNQTPKIKKGRKDLNHVNNEQNYKNQCLPPKLILSVLRLKDAHQLTGLKDKIQLFLVCKTHTTLAKTQNESKNMKGGYAKQLHCEDNEDQQYAYLMKQTTQKNYSEEIKVLNINLRINLSR